MNKNFTLLILCFFVFTIKPNNILYPKLGGVILGCFLIKQGVELTAGIISCQNPINHKRANYMMQFNSFLGSALALSGLGISAYHIYNIFKLTLKLKKNLKI